MSYLPTPLNPLPPREGKKTFYKVIKGGNEKVIQILNLTPEVDKGDGDRGGPGQLPERFLAQAQGGLNPRRLGHRFGQKNNCSLYRQVPVNPKKNCHTRPIPQRFHLPGHRAFPETLPLTLG
jgi:hypothetical protein